MAAAAPTPARMPARPLVLADVLPSTWVRDAGLGALLPAAWKAVGTAE
jgi:hypothetical protein